MTRYWVLIVLIVLIGFLALFGIPHTDKQMKSDYGYFNESIIDGVIEYIKIKHHGDCFKIQGDSSEFVFYSYAVSQMNQIMPFGDIAKKGDRIYKPAFSDTLKLIKQGKEYLFTFKKNE